MVILTVPQMLSIGYFHTSIATKYYKQHENGVRVMNIDMSYIFATRSGTATIISAHSVAPVIPPPCLFTFPLLSLSFSPSSLPQPKSIRPPRESWLGTGL